MATIKEVSMDDKIIPNYNHDDATHQFIWNSLAYKLKEEDFEAIQKSLETRRDDHIAIDRTERMFVPFGGQDKMYQPRMVPEHMRERAHLYVDWDCACDILFILSKYCEIYSRSH